MQKQKKPIKSCPKNQRKGQEIQRRRYLLRFESFAKLCLPPMSTTISKNRHGFSFQKQMSSESLKKFLKFGVTSSDKTGIYALICFDAVLADAVNLLVCYIDPDQSTGCDNRRELCWAGRSSTFPKTNRGRIPQESIERLNEMLPVATSNLLSICSKVFYKYYPSASDSKSDERTVGNTESDMH